MAGDLHGAVVVITGASSGTRRCAATGCGSGLRAGLAAARASLLPGPSPGL
jgi:NADP-dependent 3-hydroxy acid dehydrogenase YdfG